MWIKDGFITYGYSDWHFFPQTGKMSACKSVMAHTRGWQQAVPALPDGTSKVAVCAGCLKAANRATVPTQILPKMTVKCEKQSFYSHAEAEMRLVHLRVKRTIQAHEGKMERKVYKCKTCDLWHLTSKS